ncbi:hypothetical protein [Phenylobacterium sp.]|uniref:hypothetical protein n=1 Tax=Phenylobacterium sp. TaxID=1871053 RepID=UPI003D2B5B58
MPKDQKPMKKPTPPQELPMPKYDYQKSQGGSVSSRYKEDDAQSQVPAHILQNVHFG